MTLLSTLISEIDAQATSGQTDLGQLRSPNDTPDDTAPTDGKRKFIATVKDEKGEHIKKKVKARSIADIKHYFGDKFVSAQLHDDAERDDDIANIDKDDAAPVSDDEEPDKKLGGSNDGGGEVGGVDEGMQLAEMMLKDLLKTAPYWDASLPRLNQLGKAAAKKPAPIPEPTNEASTPFQKFKSLARKYQLAKLNGNETDAIEKKIKAMPNGVKLMSIARAAERKFSDLAGPHHSVGAAIPKADLKKADAVLDRAEALLTEGIITEMAKRVSPAKFWDMAVDAEGVDGAQSLSWPQIKAIADKNDVLIPVYIRDNKLGRARWTAKPKDMTAPAHHPKVEGSKPAPKDDGDDIVTARRKQLEKEVAAHMAKKPKAEEPKEAPPSEKKAEYDKSDFKDVHFIHGTSYLSTRELYAEIKKIHGVGPDDTERLPIGKGTHGKHGVRIGTSYIVKKGTHDVVGYWDVTGAEVIPGRGFTAHGRGGVARTAAGKKAYDEAKSYGFLMRPEHGTPYISVGTQHSYGPWTKDEAEVYTRDKYEHHEYDDDFGHGTIQVIKVKKVDGEWVKA